MAVAPFITTAGLFQAWIVFQLVGAGLFFSWWPRDQSGRLMDPPEAQRVIVLRLVRRPPPPGFGQMLVATLALGFAILAHALS